MGVCIYTYTPLVLSCCPLSWFFIARASVAFHLIVVEAISLLVEHLKNQFWISSHCFNLLQTLNGALSLWELET